MKALGLRPRAFISFLVFGNPNETLTLVFDILHPVCQWIVFLLMPLTIIIVVIIVIVVVIIIVRATVNRGNQVKIEMKK